MCAASTKVLVAMSGGVDSSVAAAILRGEGHDVVGCFMRLGSVGEELAEAGVQIKHRGCCSIDDAHDARHVAAALDIPFYALDFKGHFNRVIDYFVDEYNAGRTPNPCVRCNDWLKFGHLHDYAARIGATHVASGHHARIVQGSDGAQLHRGADDGKDQSYVLFGASRQRLSQMLLPIGHMRKDDVRDEARRLGLPVSEKPDSQEICFVQSDSYADLIEERAPGSLSGGAVLDQDGKELGRHRGHQRFTVGQRRGVGVASDHALYVLAKDPACNTVTIGPEAALRRSTLRAADANWLVDPCAQWRSCGVRIRYNTPIVPGAVRDIDGDLEIRFDQPQSGVAPGQAAVCYEDDRVICGGWIEAAQ